MFKAVKRWFLTIFGDIKIYKWPFFMIYCPDTFKVKGKDTRAALEMLKPGDIVLRKYVHYLDGYFIPGKYSHSSVYVGDGKIVHAVADGVEYIDVIDFLRCDGFCILRQDDEELAKKAVEFVKEQEAKKAKYDFNFTPGNDAYYCHELSATAYASMNIEMKSSRILRTVQSRAKVLGRVFLRRRQIPCSPREMINIFCAKM